MSDVDFYEILELAPDADDAAVTAAVAAQRRIWQARTGHPRLETRQLAEQRMADVSEAERVLLDPTARAAFDRARAEIGIAAAADEAPEPERRTSAANDRAAHGGAGPRTRYADPEDSRAGEDAGGEESTRAARPVRQVPAQRSSQDWTSIAADYYERGAYDHARTAAQQAVGVDQEDASAWQMLALASWQTGDRASAQFEFSEAERLDPHNEWTQACIGDFHSEVQAYAVAIVHYRRALAIDPTNAPVRSMIGVCLIEQGQIDAGCLELERAHRDAPGDAEITARYAGALTDLIRSRWSRTLDGTPVILSQAQLDYATTYLAQIDALHVQDEVALAHAAQVRGMVQHASTVKIHSWKGIGWIIFLELALLFVVLPLLGLAGDAAIWWRILVVVVFVLGVPALWVWSRIKPGWKWYRAQQPAAVRATGLQDPTRSELRRADEPAVTAGG
ncbi:hypothetical protein F8O01_02650 [Pseudoclavibacter chungangensis]|uniref:J domain-containing protein n=1 Tax=Pseudoclavibacter chungangensis TaxID=587635 RepID=A0A7J5C015_9MICO|nr:tetratricopeptide repeat protein [Pseudoclavibacter chungangensis]KAB1660251.1 hypothetical protein F8O01_02650 [Pseudoclavibacter chungangensis]NYJ65592.1 Tfp pilus assembly protein PilF [Pseudoclavibacter chungangensis]